MISQAFSKRRRHWLILVAITLSIICSFSVFSDSSWSSLTAEGGHRQAPPLQGGEPVTRPAPEAIVANSSPSTTKRSTTSLFQQLDLTSEQQQRIKQVYLQYRRQIHKKKAKLTRLQQQLSDMMVGTEPVELLRAKNQQMGVLRQQIGTLRFESMLATREILTPQQRRKFRELVASQLAQ